MRTISVLCLCALLIGCGAQPSGEKSINDFTMALLIKEFKKLGNQMGFISNLCKHDFDKSKSLCMETLCKYIEVVTNDYPELCESKKMILKNTYIASYVLAFNGL